MHPLNALLERLGFHMSRVQSGSRPSREFKKEFDLNWGKLPRSLPGWKFKKSFRYDGGNHPENYQHFESAFAAEQLVHFAGREILDIGSYRHFVLGLMARGPVTTIDVRHRQPICSQESIITCDAKKLNIPSDRYDAVVSLCALEHFGLGRYGDEFDLGADRQAFKEMIRVIKPGGALIFSTLITRGSPTIEFNAHRIYDLSVIRDFCGGLKLKEERYYISRKNRFGPFTEVTEAPTQWDIYCGSWIKP